MNDVNMEKIKVRETIHNDIMYDLEGSIDDTIWYLQSLKDNCPGYTDLRLTAEYGYECTHLELTGERDETNQETKKRIEKETRIREIELLDKEKKEEQDRKEYIRLKKKFERVRTL